MKHKVGDKVLLRQTKTTVKLPFDPEAYEVKEIRGAEITARRGEKRVTRNLKRWKQLKERRAYLRKQNIGTRAQLDSEEEDYWEFGLTVTAPGQQDQGQVQEEQAEAVEEQAQARVQREVSQEKWKVALSPWRLNKTTSPGPRERKHKQPGIGTRSRGTPHTSSETKVWGENRKRGSKRRSIVTRLGLWNPFEAVKDVSNGIINQGKNAIRKRI